VKTIRIPAEIILTFPAQVKVTDEIAQAASFACEQHLNGIGMINYTGPMIQTGTLSFGLRVHMTDPLVNEGASKEFKPLGEVVEMFPTPPPDKKA
jgi:hypothetical protein